MNDAKCHTKDSLTKGITALAYLTQSARWPWVMTCHWRPIIGLACVFGPLGALFGLWLGSHLIRLSGQLIGGAGSRQHIKTAIAWASVPAVFALPLWIPQILLFGSDMFTDETPRLDAQPLLLIPLFSMAAAELILRIWGFVLLCSTIAEVQGFRSAWRGLGNIFLASAVIVVPLLVIVFGAILLSPF